MKTVVQRLAELEVGEKIDFPISRCMSIRGMASNYGLQWDRYFKTSINRELKTITVTRTK